MSIYKFGLLACILLFISVKLTGQEFQVHTGLSFHRTTNHNYFAGNSAHLYDGTIGIHYSLGYIGKEKYKNGDFPFRLFLSVDHYGGTWKEIIGAQGSYREEQIEFRKTLVSLTQYWFKIDLFKNILQINIGSDVAFLLQEQANGVDRLISTFNSYEEYINYDSKWVSNPVRLAAKIRLIARIPVHDGISIRPQYIFQRGLTNEFPSMVRSHILAHRFDIGLSVNL